jgi:hypothetical protein
VAPHRRPGPVRPTVGRSLGPVGNQSQMNVQLALAADSKTRVSISDRRTSPAASSFTGRRAVRQGPVGTLFVQTLGKEDMRPADGVGPRHLDR